jgi:CRISPR-associated protein Cas1
MTNFHNTLYVATDGAYVGREGESLRVRVEHATKLQIPMHHLASVVCFGSVTVSPEAMGACAELGIAVVFLSGTGRFLARVEGSSPSAARIRRAQYAASDDEARRVDLARSFVAGKIANSRLVLLRAARTRETQAVTTAAERLASLGEQALGVEIHEQLLGLEGEAASRYFDVFDAMLESDSFRFEKRTRRPLLNEVNAMLSFGYAILLADCLAALQAAGLDPAVGFLHGIRAGRPALALDLMEEFRSVVVDRMVMAMIRLGQVKPADFERRPGGAVLMSAPARKAFIVEYQTRKRDPMTHPLTSQAASWGLMPHLQARLLARAVGGEGEYLPFLAR